MAGVLAVSTELVMEVSRGFAVLGGRSLEEDRPWAIVGGWDMILCSLSSLLAAAEDCVDPLSMLEFSSLSR